MTSDWKADDTHPNVQPALYTRVRPCGRYASMAMPAAPCPFPRRAPSTDTRRLALTRKANRKASMSDRSHEEARSSAQFAAWSAKELNSRRSHKMKSAMSVCGRHPCAKKAYKCLAILTQAGLRNCVSRCDLPARNRSTCWLSVWIHSLLSEVCHFISLGLQTWGGTSSMEIGSLNVRKHCVSSDRGLPA